MIALASANLCFFCGMPWNRYFYPMQKYLLIGLLGLCSLPAFGQVWALDKGTVETNLSYSSLRYDRYFDPDGEVVDHLYCTPVDVQSINLDLNWGISDRFTAILKAPYVMAANRNDEEGCQYVTEPPTPDHLEGILYPQAGTLSGPGNLVTGLLYRLLPDQQLNLSVLGEWNTAQVNYITGTATGFNSAAVIPGISWGEGQTTWWTSAYLGGEIRTNGFPPALRASYEFGYKPLSWLYVAVNTSARLPGKAKEDCDCTLAWTSLYLAEQTYIAVTLKTGFTYKDFGFHLASGLAPYARNIGAAPVATAGLSYRIVKE
jgi:hypothetical protein